MQRLSPFTLIVTFVCLALVGLALVSMLPVKLTPSRTLPGFTVLLRAVVTRDKVEMDGLLPIVVVVVGRLYKEAPAVAIAVAVVLVGGG